MKGWSYISNHPQQSMGNPDIVAITNEVWEEINQYCNLNDVILDVQYDDGTIGDRPILAYASRTLFLEDGVWRSGALNSQGHLGSIRIRINPSVPNGWYVDDGTCQTGYRYDLRTVLRHEIAHGIGVSSSITPNSVGYYYGKECHPTMFDTLIKDEFDESIVSACSHSHSVGDKAYVDSVQLYNPTLFNQGSSYSHTHDSGLMYYAIYPMECHDFDANTFQLLNAIGANCTIPNVDPITDEAPPLPALGTAPSPDTFNEPSPAPAPYELSSAGSCITPFSMLYILMLVVLKWL